MILRENRFGLNSVRCIPDVRKYTFTFLTLFILLILIYGNSFTCSWHFDDFPNIVNNTNVHLKTLSWQDIKKSFYGLNISKRSVTRPLSYLTLALNYYFNHTRVFGYHLVNFIIHYLASVFLFLLIYNTLSVPLLNERFKNRAYSIALLSVALWASSPLQVTAVTYIVQRMTSMAAMFYIMSMYFYLKGRFSVNCIHKIIFFALCGITATFSFASKENSAMLPVSLILYELILIQGVTREGIKKCLKWTIPAILLFVALAIVFLPLSQLMDGYRYRPFTLAQRLLTEPRALILYMALLFYPISSQLSLLHDIEISRSLFAPWTTFPSTLIILSLIGIALWTLRRKPLISYSILFFFLNHLIEGSIFPLELIFEHRNYLPSIFFFVPIAMLAIHVLEYFSNNKSIVFCTCVAIVLVLACQAHTTYLRNRSMKTEVSLWSDVAEKSPALSRPYVNLSNALFKAGRPSEALLILKKAMGSKLGPNPRSSALPAHNLGQYYLAVGELDRAMALFAKSLQLDPHLARAYHGISKVEFFKANLRGAEKNVCKAISLQPDEARYHRTHSVILLRAGRVNEAIKEALRTRALDDTLPEPFYILGEAYRIKKSWRKAAYYFEKYLQSRPESLNAHIALIEIYATIGKTSIERQHIFALMAAKGQRPLKDILLEFDTQMNFLGPSRVKHILALIREGLSEEEQRLHGVGGTLFLEKQPKNTWRQPLLQGPVPVSDTQH